MPAGSVVSVGVGVVGVVGPLMAPPPPAAGSQRKRAGQSQKHGDRAEPAGQANEGHGGFLMMLS